MPSNTLASVGLAIAIVAGMIALHWLLWRVGRRLPLILGRRAARDGDPIAALQLLWRRRIELTLLPFKLAIWAGGLFLISELFPPLVIWRGELGRFFTASFTRPLFTVQERPFSAKDVLLLPVALAGLWVTVSVVAWLFRAWILGPARLQESVQENLTSLLRYALLLVGGVVVLQVWGFDPSTLAIFGSLLGVGIGFGLQSIANNFVSGILIGLERPIKPGDFVEVGGYAGTVQRVGGRSTSIRTLDRVSILVPNSRFLETEVINWSHGDPLSRLRIPISVAYGSPPARVRAALLGVARQHREVLADPRPEVQLTSFGESGVNYELLVWTGHPQRQNQLRSDLNFGIQAALAREGVEIPFPQHDLHLRSSHLDRIAELWGRERLASAAEEPLVAGRDQQAKPEHLEAPVLRRSWSGEELEALAQRMRSPEDGVRIADRRHLLQTYARCFVGREAVEWLREHEAISREEAVEVGNLMLERGLLHHVLDEHPFEDSGLFYRFRADERHEGDEGT